MKTIYKCAAGLFSIGVIALLLAALYLQTVLPDSFYVAQGEELDLSSQYSNIICSMKKNHFPVEAYSAAGNSYTMNLKLLGFVDIKDVNVQVVDRRVVSVSGAPFGVKMFTEGVMVVGMGAVQTTSSAISPAKEAGIQQGDVILSINGETELSNRTIGKIVNASAGKNVFVKVSRGGKVMDFTVTPALAVTDNQYHIGLWVRDSSAGIGTLTFYDTNTQMFAGLGHAICDVDTGQILPLSQGQIVHATITGVTPGQSGSPGELQGSFTDNAPWGQVYLNNVNGVYGKFSTAPAGGIVMPMAMSHEVEPGPAYIYTTVNGQNPQRYEIEIETRHPIQEEPGRNMVIRITDPRLLSASGGIVQGMSGSPIVQNNMLVGAVTHVFVNDPTHGYGIFAENMDNTLHNAAASARVDTKAAS